MSPEKVFATVDQDGNTPLYVAASLAPVSQFRAFCEVLGDLIPASVWQQPNKNGQSPLDILQQDEFQRRYVDEISEKMDVI